MKYLVEISTNLDDLPDSRKTARVDLRLPFLSLTTKPTNSTWLAVDGGGNLSHRSGGCDSSKDWGLVSTDILLMWQTFQVGIFYAFFDSLGLVNTTGTGKMSEPYFGSPFIVGDIAWTLIE
jgi:hypothetical protein